MRNPHKIYLISDSTGETLDRIFLALKAQFENFEYERVDLELGQCVLVQKSSD